MMKNGRKTRVIIADDHTLIRDGLRKILSFHEDIEVAGEARNGNEACALAFKTVPDVVLMDINMPCMNGIEATRKIKAAYPKMGIIALSIHDDEEYVFELSKAGVSAYVLKDIDSESLVETIRTVARGESVFQPSITKKLLGEFRRMAGTDSTAHLSRREIEVLAMITSGKTNREIGAGLYISEKTVKNHLTNIFRKLNVTDRTQAAMYAVKNRIVRI
jgi:DNA-binding NarL/FixJ family response regulator